MPLGGAATVAGVGDMGAEATVEGVSEARPWWESSI
jgi:hypothetical protein